ncbi:hypothetical protein [Antrihabitans spumae]|uniref:Uncharacterized protein n=2 Tax=Antrihabitans spumae TaxID=3373370 RepID=A0ABW7K561_9NOCA
MSDLTLQDIADLANVQRPVVSMWRKRPLVRGVSMPFPKPTSNENGVERFASDEVVDWLARTGRGNNPECGLDAPALAVPDGASIEDAVTLLCWCALAGEEVAETTHDERVAQVAERDVDDSFLMSEIAALRPSLDLLSYVDDLVEASLGLADALSRLETGRLQRQIGARDLAGEADDLLRCVVGACADNVGRDLVALHIDDAARALKLATDFDHHVVGTDRAVRRRAVILGLSLEPATVPVGVHIESLVGCMGSEALDRMDNIVLGLGKGDFAILVGPASILTDTLTGSFQDRRAKSLRVGNLVAALRLPRGLSREAHRQSLAIWICRGGANVVAPRVADFDSASAAELGDIAVDVGGALAPLGGRAFRFLRPIDLNAVIAGAALVPRGARAMPLRTADSQSYLERVHRATLTTSTSVEAFDVLVAPSAAGFRLAHRSLGELREQRLLIVKRGSRIDPKHASSDGTVVVLPDRAFALDPFDAARLYPRAVRTDPGDVIFVERPLPRAWVDPVGGSLVAAPARILRLRPTAEFGPQVLATVINELVDAESEWLTWRVPVFGREEAQRLETALREADRFESNVRRLSMAAQDLKKALIDGVAAGALTLDTQATTPGIAVAQR